jgi:integrase
MTALRLRFLQAWVDGEGRSHHYFRRRGYKRVRLPGMPGSAEFMAAYQAALAQEAEPIGAKRSKAGSVSAAIASYYTSQDWMAGLSEGTQGMRRPILERFRAHTLRDGTCYGDLPLGKLHADFLNAYLDKLKPHAAKNTLKALRGWLRHAKHDVTQGIKRKAKSKKHPSWTPEWCAQYETHHQIGTKARLAYALARYTGAGRSEVARMGPLHLRNGEIVIARKETGVEATIAIHPELQKTLNAAQVTGFATFLVTKTGKRFAPTDLSEQFRAWCDEAGLPEQAVMHGLRHLMGDSLAETGSTPHDVASVLGHASARSALHYTQGADRKRMARRAMQRLISGTGDEP